MMYLYVHDNPPTTATAKPHIDKIPAMTKKTTVAIGIHTGLDMMIKGVKKINPKVATVTVKPVKSSITEADIMRVKKPTNCVEFKVRSWSLRRNVTVGFGMVLVLCLEGLCLWAGLEL